MGATIINKMLVRAVYENDISRVNELLLMGADPNYTFKRKGKSCNLLKVCMQQRYVEVLKSLIQYGAGVTASLKNDLLCELHHKEKELISLVERMEPLRNALNDKVKQTEFV